MRQPIFMGQIWKSLFADHPTTVHVLGYEFSGPKKL